MSRPKPWPAEWPSGCRKRERDLDWDPVRRRVQAAAGAQAEWTSFIDAMAMRFSQRVKREVRFEAGLKARNWSGRLANAPGATSFRVAVTKCSLDRSSQIVTIAEARTS